MTDVSLTPVDVLAIFAAGLAAGTVNAVVGSGSLLTFPTLLAVGYPPVVANVTNTVGIVLGNVSGVVGYRRELSGQQDRLKSLALPALAGGLVGAALLLVLPAVVFHRVVPVLILVGVLLVVFGPWLNRHLVPAGGRPANPWLLRMGVFLTAIYGGYFGAAQGVILVAIFSVLINDRLQRLNALKNVVAAITNGVAAVLFIVLAHVAWGAVAILAVSGIVGGQLGAAAGRRLPSAVLRGAIVVAGAVAVVKLVA